jgi:RHS repeat-associated protein
VVYDGDGNRVAETVGGVTTQYLVDAENPTGYAQAIEELQASKVACTYTWGLSLIAQNRQSGTDDSPNWNLSFYGFDGHGSVRYLTDSSGTITDTYDYDAFGNLINQTGSTPNNYLFAGEQYDPALGLYYNRARYLDVRTGRFWGMDRYEGSNGSPQSLHRYLYALGNPINEIDPSGFFTDSAPYWRDVESHIRTQYVVQYWGNLVALGWPTGQGKNPLLQPDIFDYDRKKWMEIKPFTPSGVADGEATWLLYNDNFKSAGYSPDDVWEPYNQHIPSGDKVFLVQNVRGILFYSCDADERRFRQVKTFKQAYVLINQLESEERMGEKIGLGLVASGSVALGMLMYYATRGAAIANTLQLTDVENSAGNAAILNVMAPAA